MHIHQISSTMTTIILILLRISHTHTRIMIPLHRMLVHEHKHILNERCAQPVVHIHCCVIVH